MANNSQDGITLLRDDHRAVEGGVRLAVAAAGEPVTCRLAR